MPSQTHKILKECFYMKTLSEIRNELCIARYACEYHELHHAARKKVLLTEEAAEIYVSQPVFSSYKGIQIDREELRKVFEGSHLTVPYQEHDLNSDQQTAPRYPYTL